MSKMKSEIPDIIRDFGYRLRAIGQVKKNLPSLPIPD
jgi:hypothetical protein